MRVSCRDKCAHRTVVLAWESTDTERIVFFFCFFPLVTLFLKAFEALQRESPKKAARYISGSEYRAHLTKHLRRPDHPSDEYDAPITESQRIGWEVERYQRETQNLRKQTSLSTTRRGRDHGP